jgi:hypothetical protein
MRDIHEAAGFGLTEYDASMLVTAITGLVHAALTTPKAIGLRSPAEVRQRALELIAVLRR